MPRGRGIALLYGTNKITANTIWAGPLWNQKYTQSSGSGGKGGLGGGGGKGGAPGAVTYYYFAPLMGAICEGPITAFIAARTGSQWVFFDGTQPPPSWPTVLGNTPGYASFPAVGTGFEGYPLLANIGQADLIHRTQMQLWAMQPNSFQGLWAFWESNDMLDSQGNVNPINNNGFIWNGQQWNHVASSVWESQGFTLMYGTALQPPPPYITSTFPQQALSYHYTAYWFSPAWQLGQSATPPNIEWWIAGLAPYDFRGTSTGFYILDANPEAIVVDILTNPIHGLGYASSWLDTASGATMDQFSKFCVSSGLFLSAMIDGQQQAKDIIREICKETVSSVWWSEGKVKILPWWDATQTGFGKTYVPNLTPVYSIGDPHFQEKNAKDGPLELTRSDPADAYNQLSVNFGDRAANFSQNTITIDDQAAQELYGLRPAPATQAMYIADATVATISCTLQLQKQLYQRNTYTFTLPWYFFLLEPMDIVVLTDVTQGIIGMGARIQKMALQADGTYLCTAAQLLNEVYTIQARNQQPGLPTGLDIGKPPGPIAPPVIFTAPLAITNEQTQIWIAVAGQKASWGGCVAYISTDGSTYKSLGEFWGPGKYGTLKQNLPSFSGTNPDVSGTVNVQLYPPNEQLAPVTTKQAAALQSLCMLIGGTTEIFGYRDSSLLSQNSANQNTYKLKTLYRGQLGTTGVAHQAGEIFVRLDDDLIKINIDQSLKGQTLFFKFASFNTSGSYLENIARCTAYPYTVGFGVSSPFGPSSLVIGTNGMFLVFTWSEDQSPHVKGYECRYGPVGGQWETAFTAFRTAANVFHFSTLIVPPGVWQFYLASFDAHKNYSKFHATAQFTVYSYSFLCEHNFGAIVHPLDPGADGWLDWGIGQANTVFVGCSAHPTWYGLIDTDTSPANYNGPYSGYDLWQNYCITPAVATASWTSLIIDTAINSGNQRVSAFCYSYLWGLPLVGQQPTQLTRTIAGQPSYSTGWTLSQAVLHPTTYDILPDSTVGINYVPSGGTGYEVWQTFVYSPKSNPTATYTTGLGGQYPLNVTANAASLPGAGQTNAHVPATVSINYSNNNANWLTAISGQGSQTAFVVGNYIQIVFALDITDAVSFISSTLITLVFGPGQFWTNVAPTAQFAATPGGMPGVYSPFNSGGPGVRYAEFQLSWPTVGAAAGVIAISVVQSGAGTDGGTGTQTTFSLAFGTATTKGNLLLFFLGTYTNTTTPALTAFSDTAGDTWNQLANTYLSSTENLYLEDCLSALGGADTVNGTVSPGGFFDFISAEISAGLNGATWSADGGPFTAATGTGTAVASPIITTTGSNDILLAFYSPPPSHPSFTPGAGWILLNVTGYTTRVYYKIVTAPGSYQFTGTAGVAGAWTANLYAFQAVAPAGAPSQLPWPAAPASLWVNADVQPFPQNNTASTGTAGAFSVLFNQPYNVATSISVTANCISGSVSAVVLIRNITVTGFTAEIFNQAGTPIAGTINWSSLGY